MQRKMTITELQKELKITMQRREQIKKENAKLRVRCTRLRAAINAIRDLT